MKKLLTVETSEDFRRINGMARTMLHPSSLSDEARFRGDWGSLGGLAFYFPALNVMYTVARYVETHPFPVVEMDEDGYPGLKVPIGGHAYHGDFSPWLRYNRLEIGVDDEIKIIHAFGPALNTRELFFRDGDECFHVQVCRRFVERLLYGRRSPGKIRFWVNNGVKVDQARYGRKYGNEISRVPASWSLCNWESGPTTERIVHLDHWDIHLDAFNRVMYASKK